MGDAPPPPSTPPSWSKTFTHYNPLNFRRAAHRRPKAAPVYSRDFAYADNAAVVLAQHPMRARRADINADTSAKTFAELLSGPTVDIYVGPERKHWALHRNLLCHHSSFFETEFEGHEVPKGGTKDGESVLELPDDDAKGFQLLVKWLYQGQLEDNSVLTEVEKYEYAVSCHKLYMLCDKFDMLHLKNLAMDLYRANLNAAQLVPDADEINDIYRASPVGSPFRPLMTKIAARQIMDPDVDKDAETYRKCFQENPDFAVEMVNAIRSMSGGMLFDDPTEIAGCEFHDHSDSSSCGGKEAEKAVTPMANGAAKRQLPAELSAEKRTPRKLDIRQPSTPTPKLTRWQSGLTNGHAPPHTPPKAKSMAPSQSSTVNGGHPKRAQTSKTAPSQPSTVNGNAPKIAGSPAKPAPGGSVLGKRRVTEGNQLKSNGAAEAPRRSSHHVNGMVQQLNGIESGGSEGSQSQAGASEMPTRKAAPKLRRPQVNGA
ncbi:hypothetical protein LTR53_013235 [Teratosphaeriaceae sp. CCFEE 6253]|nr:hypothetical protein LTR53_013235 [Teratosphaeriaceae sp. CCFEE 6253]